MSEAKTTHFLQRFDNVRRPRLGVLPLFLVTFIVAILFFHVIYWGDVPRAIEAIKSSVSSALPGKRAPEKVAPETPQTVDDDVPAAANDGTDDSQLSNPPPPAEQNDPVSGADVSADIAPNPVPPPTEQTLATDNVQETIVEERNDAQVNVENTNNGQVKTQESGSDVDVNDEVQIGEREEEGGDGPQPENKEQDNTDEENNAPSADNSQIEMSSTTENTGLHSPLCPHIILVSAPRHGSTWFLDSVEKCRYLKVNKTTGQHYYKGAVFRETEVWHSHAGPVQFISPDDAFIYVQRNTSLKIFPKLDNKRGRVITLLKDIAKTKIPIIVLTRKVTSTFSSLTEARKKKSWNNIPASPGSNPMEIDEETKVFLTYKQEIEDFFNGMDEILKNLPTTRIDYMDYDDVKDMEYIHAKNNNCYIRNCNFIDDSEL